MARPPLSLSLYREPRRNRVIVLEDLNFFWDESELNEMAEIWRQGFSVYYISEYFERDPDEILLALMHLARQERIRRRKGGLFGNAKKGVDDTDT